MSILALALLVSAAPAPVPAASSSSASAASRAEAYYHFSLGLQAKLIGDLDEALMEYRRAQKLDPSSSSVRVEAARLLRESMKFEAAAVEAQAALAIDPNDADAHLLLALLEEDQASGAAALQALRRAAVHYEEAARLKPADAQVLWKLGNLYSQLAAAAEGPEEQRDQAAAARAWQRYVALDPGNFEAHVKLGGALLLSGHPDQAAEALKSALELRPEDARAYQILGEIYARADQAEQAVLHYRKALGLEPSNLRLRLALGEVLQRARRPAEGLEEADAVLLADARNRFALDLKGRCLRDLGRHDEAAAAADELLAAEPGDLKAAYLKVTIAEARRDYAASIALIEGLLPQLKAAEPEAAEHRRVFLLHLGYAYQQLDRHAEAAAVFGRAVAAAGQNSDAAMLNFHAEALYLAKRKDEALAAVRAARERFPEDVDLTGLQATLLREQGELAAATALVQTLRERAPGDPKVLARVADFHRRARQYPEAEAALRQAQQADPKSLSVLFQLGAVLERQKRHEEAEAVFREALLVDPESAPVLNYLGYMNADRGVKLAESLALIEKAVALDPASGAYRDSLGWVYFRLERLDEAERAVRQAVESGGANAVVYDHLGDILAARGRAAEALESWRKALEGEDEDGELERDKVEAKIRDAQRALQAQQAPAPAP